MLIPLIAISKGEVRLPLSLPSDFIIEPNHFFRRPSSLFLPSFNVLILLRGISQDPLATITMVATHRHNMNDLNDS